MGYDHVLDWLISCEDYGDIPEKAFAIFLGILSLSNCALQHMAKITGSSCLPYAVKAAFVILPIKLLK